MSESAEILRFCHNFDHNRIPFSGYFGYNNCIFPGVVQLIERAVWDREARGFEPHHSDQTSLKSVDFRDVLLVVAKKC